MKDVRIFDTDSPLSKEWYLDRDTFAGGPYDASRYLLLHDLEVAKRIGTLSDQVQCEIVKNDARLRVTVVNEADWQEVEKQINRFFYQSRDRVSSIAAMTSMPAREYLERSRKI